MVVAQVGEGQRIVRFVVPDILMHCVRDAVQEASELNSAAEAREGHVSDDCIVLFPAAGITAVADDGVRRSSPQHDGVPQVRGHRPDARREAVIRGVE
eukprot:scaffold7523_cov601-Pinguiococcus_pyrenoidosus.AAC.1